MTTPGANGPNDPDDPVVFDRLMAEVMASAERFGHRQHVHLTWLAVRRFGVPAATRLVGDGISRTARSAGAPRKFHATVTRAWVELVGHHAEEHEHGEHQQGGFDGFVERNPALLDTRLLARFYRSATLADERARTSWVEPDAAPFPWHG